LKEISVEDLAAVHKASKKVLAGIETALSASGVACVQLNGKGVNQVVMHYHLHLIPKVPGRTGPSRFKMGNHSGEYG
jgi:histidine triad (HIT) family protein